MLFPEWAKDLEISGDCNLVSNVDIGKCFHAKAPGGTKCLSVTENYLTASIARKSLLLSIVWLCELTFTLLLPLPERLLQRLINTTATIERLALHLTTTTSLQSCSCSGLLLDRHLS